MRLQVNPERLMLVLIGVIAILSIGHLVTRYFIFEGHLGTFVNEIYRLFNMNHEVSIPTWFSQMLLITAGLIALLIAGVRKAQGTPYTVHWTIVAGILCFMSIDEGASIHEIGTIVLQPALDAEGTLLHYTWILASGALVVIVALALVRFWWNLPVRKRILLFVAAATYVIGAVGFEVLGGYVSQNISTGMKLTVVHMLEESFEMLGATLAIYAFLRFLRKISPENSILITGGAPSTAKV